MTNEQFRAVLEMIVQIVKYAPSTEEAVKRIYEVQGKFEEKEKNEKNEKNDDE